MSANGEIKAWKRSYHHSYQAGAYGRPIGIVVDPCILPPSLLASMKPSARHSDKTVLASADSTVKGLRIMPNGQPIYPVWNTSPSSEDSMKQAKCLHSPERFDIQDQGTEETVRGAQA